MFFLGSANLLHGEAEIGDNLLKGNSLAAVTEVLAGGAESQAVFLGQFFFVVIVDHDREE